MILLEIVFKLEKWQFYSKDVDKIIVAIYLKIDIQVRNNQLTTVYTQRFIKKLMLENELISN